MGLAWVPVLGIRCFRLALLAVLLWSLGVGLAADFVGLDANTARLSLTPYLSLYRDTSGKMELAEVRQALAGWEVSPRSESRPTLGFTTDAIWMRFRVRNRDSIPLTGLVELNTPRMDEVDGYVLHDGGRIEHFAGGNTRTPSPQMMATRCPTFAVQIPPDGQAEVFVRVHSETSIQLPLNLWGQRAFAEAQAVEAVAYAGMFGYWSALIVLGFVFGAVSLDFGFILYSLKTLGIFLVCLILSGYWGWLGLPLSPTLAKTGVIVIGELGVIVILVFPRRLLELDQRMPRVSRWVIRAMWAGIGLTVGLMSISYRVAYPLFVIHLMLIGIGLMFVAILAWRRGRRVARIYFGAWTAFWICHGVSGSLFLVRQPQSHLPWVYILFGAVLSSTLFLVAMADRVREIRQNTLEAEKQLLAAERRSSEALRLKMRHEQSLIRDLHDGVGGLIANLAILSELGRRQAATDSDRDRFSQISQMASDGAREVRTLMNSLEAREMAWPDFLDECRCCGQATLDPHGIVFVLKEEGYRTQPGPGVVAGLSLLRVVKEAFNNAVKHARCSRVWVQFDFQPDRIRFTVRDDGVGMKAGTGEGRGLRNMESRIRELGGVLTTRGDSGLELVADLPLPLTQGETPTESS